MRDEKAITRDGEVEAIRTILRQLFDKLDDNVQHEIIEDIVRTGEKVVAENTVGLTVGQRQAYAAGYAGAFMEITHNAPGYMREGLAALENWLND